jgi:hypothetical protein
VAAEILHEAGLELTRAAASVIERLGMRGQPFETILSGSMFRLLPWLADDVVRRLAEVAPRSTVSRLTTEPARGAVHLALGPAGRCASRHIQAPTIPTRDLRGYPSEATLANALARRLVDLVRRNPAIVLGLPTGRTPLALYAELIRLTRDMPVDWSRVHTFNLDEFAGLGAGDAGSYHTFMRERLFDGLGISPAQVEFPMAIDGSREECERYEAAHASGRHGRAHSRD